jgi:hypothetical protein
MGLRALFVVAILSAGCSAEIGDECETSVDCSPDGDRVCDLAQPGGYCTIEDCTPDSCPDDALCIEFSFVEPRLARSFCMATCETSGDCREGYRCVHPADQDARVTDDHRSGEYCAQE